MIVSCGEALIDLFPIDDHGVRWEACAGGSPLNVAIAVARLDVEAGFLGRLGRDRFGDLLLRHIVGSGVSRTYVSIGDEPTAIAIVEPGGANHEPGFSFHGEGSADRALRAEDAVLGGEVSCVHLAGSVTLLMPPADEVLVGVMAASRGRRLVTLDPNVRPTIAGSPERLRPIVTRWLGYCDLVKISRADLDWLYPGEDPMSVAGRFLDEGPVAVVVTKGGDGSEVVTATRSASAAATPVVVADTVGAGDSFMGGLLVWLHDHDALDRAALEGLTDEGWSDALTFAGKVAAITSSRTGADPPTRAELS